MNWHYLPELAAEYSEANSSDGEPCAPLKSIPSVGKCSCDVKWMDAYRDFLFGMTSERSTVGRGEDVSMLSLEDSRVRISVLPEEERASTETDPDYGKSTLESLARYDRSTRSWKTRQRLLLGDYQEYSETWPKWGMMRSGECWALSTSVLRTFGNESGSLLPTPCTIDSGSRFNQSPSKGAALRPTLGAMAKFSLWPTPRKSDAERCDRDDLIQAIRGNQNSHFKTYPTPTARDWKDGTAQACQNVPVNGLLGRFVHQTENQNGGSLNPTWVEWLMNWVPGWTSLEPLNKGIFDAWEELQWNHSGTQDMSEDFFCKQMLNMRIDRVSREEPQGQKPDEQFIGECSNIVQNLPRKTPCTRQMEEQMQRKGVPLVQPDIPLQAEQRDNVLDFLCKQISLGKTWWQDDPSNYCVILRTAIGIANRVDRIRAIGNGQVPEVARLAFEILRKPSF